MKVIKRDGHMVEYCPEKIENAILKANKEVEESERVSLVQIRNIIKYIERLGKKRILVEDIQDIIEIKLMTIGKFALAKKYITYRYTRELVRKSNTTDVAIKGLINGNDFSLDLKNNKNTRLVNVQRDYLAGITSTDITRRFLLPEEIVKAHDDGIIYFNNMEYFAQNALYNSSIINLYDMLNNGTNINDININRPLDFKEAVDATIQIIGTVLTCQYGSLTINLGHLASFVADSYKKYVKKYQFRDIKTDLISIYAAEDLKDEVSQGIKTLLYGISSLTAFNGKVVGLVMYLGESNQYKEELALLIEEVLKQNIAVIENNDRNKKILLNPKLIYILEEDNINKEGKYYYLTELAINSLSKTMSPDFISEKIMKEMYSNYKCFPCVKGEMFLPSNPNLDKLNYCGRFNQGVVTLNLVDVALCSDKNIDLFFTILDERLELCHTALQIRHKRLSNVSSASSPILWQYGAISRLGEEENIHEFLHNGCSTISMSFAGLYECVKFIMGKSFSDSQESLLLAHRILEKMDLKCKKWSEVEKIAYVLSGTSSEEISYKFASCLKEKFGLIKGVTDKDYITDSYHIPLNVKINLSDRIAIESKLQRLVLGGSYFSLEIGSIQNLAKKIEELLKYLYDNILYTQINSKIDYCFKCGYLGMMRMRDDLSWQCPKCKNTDERKMNIYRRFHGEISKNKYTDIQKEELKLRNLYFDEEEGKEIYEY